MVKKTQKKRYLSKIPILIIIITVGLLFGIYHKKTSTSTTVNTMSLNPTLEPVKSEIFNTIYQKIEEADDYYVAPPKIVPNKDTWWITEDNWSILVPSNETFSGNTYAENIIKSEMIKNGFSLNMRNSSNSNSDKRFYDYVQAYEKENQKCVVTVDPDRGVNGIGEVDPSFTLSCFYDTALQAAYNQQIPFLKGLDERNAIINDLEVKSDKATMGIHGRRAGGLAFMYKSGNEWKTIIKWAQAVPDCNELQQNNIPPQYWIDCYVGTTIKKGNF